MQRLDRQRHPRFCGIGREIADRVTHPFAGREGRIATYQVCDWKTPLPADVLLSRHYPGEGVIDLRTLTEAVVATGYDRDVEVEIFHADIWADDPAAVVRRTAETFGRSVSPFLAPADSRAAPSRPAPSRPA